MKKFLLYFVGSIILFCQQTPAQNRIDSKVDFSGAEAYLSILDTLSSRGVLPKTSWDLLFQNPVYQMMLSGGKLDSNRLRAELLALIKPSKISDSINTNASYHFKNFTQVDGLKQIIDYLKGISLSDSIKKLLYPYLPKRLHKDSYFPRIFYIPYGSEEATGIAGVVIHDISLSLKADRYKPGLIAAHEAFHSVVSLAFQQSLKQNIDYNSIEFDFLYFLQNVSEEGTADLIDKKILSQKASPLYGDVLKLMNQEDKLAKQSIIALNQFLLVASESKSPFSEFKSYSDFVEKFGKNGGHIPGRFMANVIKKKNVLNSHIKQIEDPISFFESYYKAASKDRMQPNFSEKSIVYLKTLREKFQKSQKVVK